MSFQYTISTIRSFLYPITLHYSARGFFLSCVMGSKVTLCQIFSHIQIHATLENMSYAKITTGAPLDIKHNYYKISKSTNLCKANLKRLMKTLCELTYKYCEAKA